MALVASALLMLALDADAAFAASAYVTNNAAAGGVYQFGEDASGALSALNPAVVGTSQTEGVAVSPDGSSVYVTESGGKLAQFSVNADGTLAPKSPATVATGNTPTAVAVSPDDKHVYVSDLSNASGPGVWQYDVGAGGALTNVRAPSGATIASCVVDFAISPDSQHVYGAVNGCVSGGSVVEWNVNASGNLTGAGGSAPTVANVHRLAITPDGTSLYATAGDPNRNCPGSSCVGGAIFQFDVGAGGALTPKSTASVPAPSGFEVGGITISPDGSSVYANATKGFCNQTPSLEVLQYDVGAGGLLAAKSPATVAVNHGDSIGGIAATADRKAVYVTFGGACTGTGGGVAEYTVGAGGALTEVGTVDTGQGPDRIAVLPVVGGSGGASGGGGSGGGGGSAGGPPPTLATTTGVTCNYLFTGPGAFSDVCTATVSSGTSHIPTGDVQFSSNAGGTFVAGSRCTLAPVPSSPTASCSVRFIPPATASPVITAHYLGDSQDQPSTGSTSGPLLSASTASLIGSASIAPSTITPATSGGPCAGLAPGISCAPVGTKTACSLAPGISCTAPGTAVPCSLAPGISCFPKATAARKKTVGARVNFQLKAPAVVAWVVQRRAEGRKAPKGACVAPTKKNRKRRRCKRFATLPKGFRMTFEKAGSYSFVFRGRVGGKTLAPGSYRLAAIPFVAKVPELPRFVKFKVR